MSQQIGSATCPICGLLEITDVDSVTVYMGKGISNPYIQVECQKCGNDFVATITWESAYIFDKIGCEVVGFSPATAEAFGEKDISVFMAFFNEQLEEFLNIIDYENS